MTTSERFTGVSTIAVLRGGGLGDTLFALPAMQALAATYPGARLILLGSESGRQLFGDRPGVPHEVHPLPVYPGVHEPPGARPDPSATELFFRRLRREGVDVAVQLHGGGANSNPFVARIGARHTVGGATPEALQLERSLPFAFYQHEVLRALEIAGLAGASPVALEPVLNLTPQELSRARRVRGDDAGPVVAIHPGATDVRRRWPVERFAEIAARVARRQGRVLVIGGRDDVPAALAIARRAHSRNVLSLAGRLDLSQLVSVLLAADVLVGNDSGPRHLAQALGTATVGVYWIGNLVNAGPLTRARHRVRIGWTTRCPTCGLDCTAEDSVRCEHDASYVQDVAVDDVWDDVECLMATSAPRHER